MKIYNEVVLYWNELTNQFDTTYEDSYNYDGPVALAQGSPPNSTAMSAQDTIADTIKTTAGYFTSGDGTSGIGSGTVDARFPAIHDFVRSRADQDRPRTEFGSRAGTGPRS